MATAVIGALRVNLGLDSAEFSSGLKKAQGSLDDFEGKLANAAKVAAGVGVAVAGAAAAIGVAMLKSSAESAREVTNLANAAGTGTEEFRRLAYAAKTVGVEQDKLSDILKDVRDRVGDFLITGAGPMADFFETVAPKIGLTIDAFKGLSGPEALLLFKNSLDKANVSAEEQVFFLEAMASDLTLLQPLLANGGGELRRLSEEAGAVGLALSDIETEQIRQASFAFERLGAFTAAFADQLTARLAPILTAVADGLFDAAKETGGFGAAIDKSISLGIHLFAAITREIFLARIGFDKLVGDILNGFDTLAGAVPNGLAAVFGGEASDYGFKPINQAYGRLQETLQKPWSSEELEAWVQRMREESEKLAQVAIDARKITNTRGGGIGTGTDVGEDTERQDRLAQQLEALRGSLMTEEEAELASYEARMDLLRDFLEDRKVTVDEFNELEARAKQEHADAMTEIDELQAEEAARIRQDLIGRVSGLMSALSGLIKEDGEKSFKINKAISMATGAAKGIESAISAYAAGMTVGGPPVAAAYAAVSVATTAAQLAQLNAVQPGSSGGGGGGSVSSSAAASAPAVQTLNLSLQGISASQFYSGDQVRELAQTLVQYQRDGGQLVLVET